MQIKTAMVTTARTSGPTLAAWWDGGREVRVHVESGSGGTAHVETWNVWNDEWGCPLVEQTPEAFERFVRLRLEEPGTIDHLLTIDR